MTNTNTKKNNIPYYITAFSATLLFAGIVVFAVAPYIEFLTPIAALGFGAPLIAAFAIPLTMLVFALSYNAVRQNKALAEKETQLAGKEEEIEAISKTIAEQETQLVKKTEEIEAQNQTFAEIKAQLTGKTEKIKAQNQTLAEIKAQLTGKTEKIKAQNQTLAEIKAQLTEKDRMLQEEDNRFAESLFENISGDGVAQPRNDLHETLQNEKKLVFAPESSDYEKGSLEGDRKLMKMGVPFSETISGIPAESGSSGAKAAKQTESGWSSSKQALGAGIGATFGLACLFAQRFISPTSNALSPTNDFSGVGDLYNNNYCPSSSYTHPNNTQAMLDNKLDQAEKMLNLSHESAKKDFGADPDKYNFVNDEALRESTEQNISTSASSMIKEMFFNLLTSSVENMLFNLLTSNVEVVEESTQVDQNDPCYTVPSGFVCNNRTTNYATPPMQTGKTVKQNILTSVYSRMKDRFFSLFTSEDTTYNPESYTNGIAYEAASKKQADAVNEVVGSTQVGQNDPAKNCIVLNTRQYDNQTVAPTPCPLSTYQVPLPGLRHVALCCPSIAKSAPSSGP